jgi:hypothetical protein
MTEKYLSTETVNNVVRSVVSKLNPDLVNQLNKTVDKFKQLSSSNVRFKNAEGKVNEDDKDEQETLKEQFNERLKEEIKNNLLVFVADGLESETIGIFEKVFMFINTITGFEQPSGTSVFVPYLNNEKRLTDWYHFFIRHSHVESIVAFMFLTSKINRQNMLSWARKDFYLPVDFLLTRPYMTYDVSSAIVMKAGTDTGETIIGDQKFEMTSNIGDRTMYGNYFYYSKAIVKKDRNVIVAPNVFIQNYIKGNNCTFVTMDDVSRIREYSGLLDGTRSILAFMIPVNDQVDSVNAIDIRGRRDGMTTRQDCAYFFQTAPYYNTLLQIDSIGVDDPVTSWVDYEDVTMQANTICFLGHTETVDGHVLYRNTGHLGQYTYDGVHMSRRPGHYAKINPLMAR